VSVVKSISIFIPYQKKGEVLYLWTQVREGAGELAGKLEFPGGKVEDGENPKQACLREVLEETGNNIADYELTPFGIYQFPPLVLFVFLAEDRDGKFPEEGFRKAEQYLELRDQIPPNNINILEDLISRFQ
jgi:8-oxo-dGTP diphosphatase